jgi:hypothetical protein
MFAAATTSARSFVSFAIFRNRVSVRHSAARPGERRYPDKNTKTTPCTVAGAHQDKGSRRSHYGISENRFDTSGKTGAR